MSASAAVRITMNCPFATVVEGRVERSLGRNSNVVSQVHWRSGWSKNSLQERVICLG